MKLAPKDSLLSTPQINFMLSMTNRIILKNNNIISELYVTNFFRLSITKTTIHLKNLGPLHLL